MKGHKDSDGRFHPHTKYKSVRKSRDQTTKTQGVKIRKQREIQEPSKMYMEYIMKFPDSYIARDVKQFGVTASHGHFGDALKEGRYEDAMYRADSENLVRLHELGIEKYLSRIQKHPDDPSPYDTFISRYNWAKEYIKTKDRFKLDEPKLILETELYDILQEVGDIRTGDINYEKLDKVVEENILEILKREKKFGKGDSISIYHVATRPETGEIEFKKTGRGDSGFYQYDFRIYDEKGNTTGFGGTAYGDIEHGDVIDMQLELYNEGI